MKRKHSFIRLGFKQLLSLTFLLVFVVFMMKFRHSSVIDKAAQKTFSKSGDVISRMIEQKIGSEKSSKNTVVNQIAEVEPEHVSVAILIQQSPVDKPNQISRLKYIDSTWAQWTEATDNHMQVFAAIPLDSVMAMAGAQFTNILPVIITNSFSSDTPMYRFMRFLVSTILSRTNMVYKWIVMCNDHTFMVPQNLECFLGKYNPDELIYTGNKLAISYRDGTLPFASGGAGLVFSHVAVNIMLITWVLNKNEVFGDILDDVSTEAELDFELVCPKIDDLYNIPKPSISGDEFAGEKVNAPAKYAILYMGSEMGMPSGGMPLPTHLSAICTLRMLWDWLDDQDTDAQLVRIELSGRVVVDLAFKGAALEKKIRNIDIFIRQKYPIADEPNGEEYSKRFETTDGGDKNSRNNTFLRGREIASKPVKNRRVKSSNLDSCNALTQWEKDNPGIIVAHCLQRVYGAKYSDSVVLTRSTIPDSTVSYVNTYGEPFNAYGPVRLLSGDVDSWYTDAKALVVKNSTELVLI